MKLIKIFGGLMSAFFLVLVITAIVQQAGNEKALGSVDRGNEYKATTTIATTVAGTYYVTNTTTDMVTFGSAGTLGSIVITSSSLSGFSVFDGNKVATTTIAVFPANAAVGTYTFDVSLYRGLSIVVPASFTGNIVTTYRP